MGLAFIGVSGAVIAYVSAMVQGEKETLAFTQALAKTGDLAGMTGSQLSAMALAVGSATGEFNDSTKAVLELAQAGFGASPALQGMAESAVRFGKATGDMKAGIEFATVAMGGSAKQIEDLDAKYNLLTASQANEVQYLFQIGEADKARQIVMRDGSAALAKRASEVEDSTGSIIKAWNAVTTAVSSAWHEMAHAGATDIESRLKAVNAQLASAQGVHMNASQQFVPNASPSVIASLKSTQAQLQAQLVQQGWDRTMQALDDARNKAAKGAQEWAATALAPIDELQSKLDIAVKMKEAFFAVPRTAAESARFMRSYNEQIAKAAQAYGGPSSTRGSGRASRDNSDKLRQMGVDDIRKQIEAQGRLNDEKARGDAIAAQFVATLHEQVAAQKNAIDIQVASVGMGQKEAERLRELNQLDQQRIQQVQRLQREQVTHPEQYAALQRQIDAVNASFGDMRDTMIDGFHRMDTAQGEWSNGFTSALQDFADQAADVAGQTHDLFLNAFNGMADGIGNFVQTGKFNLADFTRSFLADLAKMETRILISRILMQIFGGAVSYAGGTGAVTGMGAYSGFGASGTVIQTYNAAGNVFSGPGIAAYENQIVTRPTYFANGGNVMGEAGPEAIMPLSRGSDGKLGVKAQGSNVTVIVENHSDSKAEVSQSKDSNGNDILKVMIGAAVNEVNKQIGRGGSTGQVIQQTFGLSRRGVPVAG
ncbi:MAG TPA: phage tail tape measure protein [Rhodanobacteraceae bacterium]|nr:phage tail tape measure protein [Rhodanobacteraceae bacterium]